MVRIENKKELVHSDISEKIIGCCFEIMQELGAGFLEKVYKNALFLAMKQRGLSVLTEQLFEVTFRGHKVGRYIADLIVEDLIVVELKCVAGLMPEHQAQVINYLKASGMAVGLLVNFGHQKLEYKRLHHPSRWYEMDGFKEKSYMPPESNET